MPGSSTPSEADGFNKVVSIATLALVGLVAILALLDMRAGRLANASPAAAEMNNTLAALSQSVSDTRQSVARLEQKFDRETASRRSAAAAPAPRRNCVRVYRGGVGMRRECGR